MGYEQCCMTKRADKNESVHEWSCSGCLLCAHTFTCQPLRRPESNYRIQSGNGKYICHTLSHSDYGLKFAINLNFPLVPDKAFVLSGWCKMKGARAQELTWSYHYIYRYSALCAICFALFLFTEQTHQLRRCQYSITVPLGVTGTNVGWAVGYWKVIKLHFHLCLLKSLLSDMAATDGLHSK